MLASQRFQCIVLPEPVLIDWAILVEYDAIEYAREYRTIAREESHRVRRVRFRFAELGQHSGGTSTISNYTHP